MGGSNSAFTAAFGPQRGLNDMFTPQSQWLAQNKTGNSLNGSSGGQNSAQMQQLMELLKMLLAKQAAGGQQQSGGGQPGGGMDIMKLLSMFGIGGSPSAGAGMPGMAGGGTMANLGMGMIG